MARNHQQAARAREAAAQERSELRTALEEEKRGYVTRGLDERAKAVDDQIKALAKLDAQDAKTTPKDDGDDKRESAPRQPRGSARAAAKAASGEPADDRKSDQGHTAGADKSAGDEHATSGAGQGQKS
ncbi:hypothetical protein [Actinotalea sp. JY-7876]|uniref:hypothetical protein n=1 Tax=Actinotalea sp. JY-7876 TaxID=2758442 RepID=UPI0015F3D94E|nr:hypothetical protein [Actinotalea sp. JY-7876]